MRKHIDYRLPAALLSLTLLGGSAVLGEEPRNREVFGLDYKLVEQPCGNCQLKDFDFLDHLHGLVRAAITSEKRPAPLAFDFAVPVGRSGDAMLMLCGHVCDGERCYETDDAAADQTVVTELAADAKEDLNFRIETREVAPPMPMLRTKQTAATNADQTAPARCELGSPVEAVASQAIPSIGAETLEVVRLRSELEAAQHQLRTQREHHEEVLGLLEQLHETKTQVAEVAAKLESRELFCRQWGGLVEEHFKTVAERSVLQSKYADAEQLHESELEATRLTAELSAAKEWISQRVAAEQAAMPPFVSYPYPQPFFVPPSMIPAPLAVYEPQFVTSEVQSLPTARPQLAQPVPFAVGTYVPGESASTCPACPASASSEAVCSSSPCSEAACSSSPCSEAACSSAPCSGCSDSTSPAVCGMTVCGASEKLTTATVASAACDCGGCDGEDCVCTGCVCSDAGVCGCVAACPKSDCPTSETADANVASRGDAAESAESR